MSIGRELRRRRQQGMVFGPGARTRAELRRSATFIRRSSYSGVRILLQSNTFAWQDSSRFAACDCRLPRLPERTLPLARRLRPRPNLLPPRQWRPQLQCNRPHLRTVPGTLVSTAATAASHVAAAAWASQGRGARGGRAAARALASPMAVVRAVASHVVAVRARASPLAAALPLEAASPLAAVAGFRVAPAWSPRRDAAQA